MIALIVVVCIIIVLIIAIVIIAIKAQDAVFPTKSSRKIYSTTDGESCPGEQGYVKGIINTKVYDDFDKHGNDVIVLYCHGNTGNITQRGYVTSLCKRLGWNLVLFDYRGYGRSKKSPSSKNISEDALAIYRETREKNPKKTIVIWGESLGGGPAVYITEKEVDRAKNNRLVLLSTYSSLTDVIEYGTQDSPFYKKIKALFLEMGVGNIDNTANIRNTATKTTIIHSTEDHFINFKNAEKLHQAAGANSTLIAIKGDHPSPIITLAQLREILENIAVPHDSITEKELQEMVDGLQHAATVYHLKSQS